MPSEPRVSPSSFPFHASWMFLAIALGETSSVVAQDAAPATKPGVVGQTHVYRKTPQGELAIEVFRASDAAVAPPRPGIVFFHGGGWKNGDRKQFRDAAEYLASRGLIAATADYRLASKHQTGPDAAVEDAQYAIRWFRAHAKELGVDPARIAAGGGSAGGHLAACTALLPEPQLSADEEAALKAATRGATDAPVEPAALPSSRPNALVLFNPVLDLAGLPIQGKTATGESYVEALSPIRFVRADAPPTIAFFGSADKYLDGAERYQEKVARLEGRCELFVADGEKHGFFNREPWKATTLKAADEFLASLGWVAGEATIAAPEGGFRKLVASDVRGATESRAAD